MNRKIEFNSLKKKTGFKILIGKHLYVYEIKYRMNYKIIKWHTCKTKIIIKITINRKNNKIRKTNKSNKIKKQNKYI